MPTRKRIRKANQTRSILGHPYIKKQSGVVWAHNKLRGGKYPKWKVMHTGGKQGTVTTSGYTFVYDDTGDTILCVAKKGICFKISFDEESRTIGVDISYSAGCSINKPLPKSHGTLIMLQAILELVLTRSNISIYKCIVITDNSSIECASHYDGKPYEIKLMDMYYVSTGCTWYSSLAPMFMYKESDEKTYIVHKSQILSSMSWTDFVNKLPSTVQDVINSEIAFENPETENEPAHVILNKIRQNRYHCIFFKLYMGDFLRAFGVDSMYGKEWCIPLQNGKIVYSNDELLTSCKHAEKGCIIPPQFMKELPYDAYMRVKKDIQIADVPKTYTLEKNLVHY